MRQADIDTYLQAKWRHEDAWQGFAKAERVIAQKYLDEKYPGLPLRVYADGYGYTVDYAEPVSRMTPSPDVVKVRQEVFEYLFALQFGEKEPAK